MAELLLAGVTHYPPLCWRDEDMAGILRTLMKDPAVPADKLDPANWPEGMRREWGEDEARSSGAAHRAELVAGFAKVRAAIEDFDPDFVLVWGDDQYENFREDLIPPFALLAYEDLEAQPFLKMPFPNVWGEDREDCVQGQGSPRGGSLAGHPAARGRRRRGLRLQAAPPPQPGPRLPQHRTVPRLPPRRVPVADGVHAHQLLRQQGDLGPGSVRALRSGGRARPARRRRPPD